MVTNDEMKKCNEEILEKWRTFGFLKGLKEGSINEWRCAKSFNDMAEYCLSHENEISGEFATLVFPLIRRCVCTGKNRLHRSIKPTEIIDVLNNTTLSEAIKLIFEKKDLKGKNGMKSHTLNLMKNFVENVIGGELNCMWFLIDYEKYGTNIEMFKKITGADFEAEICAIFSDVITLKLT